MLEMKHRDGSEHRGTSGHPNIVTFFFSCIQITIFL